MARSLLQAGVFILTFPLLDHFYVQRFGALGRIVYVEADLLSAPQTVSADAHKLILVDKDLITHFANNESEALAWIEPLDLASLFGQRAPCQKAGWT
jgi:hypothetical protein